MNDQDKFDYYKGQANALVAQLATMTDPAKIAATMEEINRLTNLAWGIQMEQGEDVAGQKQAEWLNWLDAINQLAQERLDIAEEEAITAAKDLADAVRIAVGEAVVPMTDAAENMAENTSDINDHIIDFGRHVTSFGGSVALMERDSNNPFGGDMF